MKRSNVYKFYTTIVLFLLLLYVSISFAMTISKVAVIGATGRLGRLTVQKLVDQGIACNIFCRKMPETSIGELPEDATSTDVAAYLSSLKGVNLIQGDVGNTQALTDLVQDCDACLAVYGSTRKSKLSDLWKDERDTDPTHAKQVNYQGVLNILEACKASKRCKRIVRITGKGEDPTGIFSVLINLLGSMAKAWNYQGEQALRGQSEIDYTVIRPGIMSNEGPGLDEAYSYALADDGGDLAVAKIAYQDIAALCVDCLAFPNAARSTLTAMTTTTTTSDGTGSGKDWKPLLEKVQPDQRSFPSDMLEQHYSAVQGFVLKLAGFSALFLAILAKLLFF